MGLVDRNVADEKGVEVSADGKELVGMGTMIIAELLFAAVVCTWSSGC